MSATDLKSKFTDSDGVLLLPDDFDQLVAKLEKEFKTCTMPLERFRELLECYKAAITYYTNRNERRKNEFISKYKCVLGTPYATQLMKTRTPRAILKKKQEREIREEAERAKVENVVAQIRSQFHNQTKVLKTDLEKQEDEFQKRLLAKKGSTFSVGGQVFFGGGTFINSNEWIATKSTAESDEPELDLNYEGKQKRPTVLVMEDQENTVEGILKSWIEDLRSQIEQIENEKDKALDELAEKFEMQKQEIKEKIDEKYDEVIAKSQTLPQSIREASLKKLNTGREAELKKELEILNVRHRQEKERLNEHFIERLHNLTDPDQASEIALKVKDAVRTSSTCTPLISPEDKFPTRRPYSRIHPPPHIIRSASNATKGKKHFVFPPDPPMPLEEDSKTPTTIEMAESRSKRGSFLVPPGKSTAELLNKLSVNSYAAQFITKLKRKVQNKKENVD